MRVTGASKKNISWRNRRGGKQVELKTFRGGIHPPYQKEATAGKATEDISLPAEVVIPMQQHVGAPNSPTVKAGDRVEIGQKIGASDAFISAPVHASVSGTVKAVEDRKNFTGASVPCVVITVDPSQPAKFTEKRDVSSLTPEQIRDIAKEAGLVGLGGAAFPSYVKLSPPPDKPIDTVIINGCECEPFLTCDHRLMLERPDDLVAGLKLIMKAVGAKKGFIGVEANKMDAVDKLVMKVANEPDIEVAVLEVKYPEGAEKMLIDAITGRRVPPGKLPSEVGVLVQNVQTAVALYDAATTGKPVVERVITVTGPGVKNQRNVNVRIGTPIAHVLEQCGGITGNPGKVIIGGPMTGFAQKDLSASVVKGTSGILVLTEEAVNRDEEQQCVGCDKCLDVCAMFLMPNFLVRYAKRGQWDLAEKYGAKDCFECGCCSYVCPARIQHVAYVRKAKAELAAAQKK
jgi:electron transport complex protein RnfC